MGEPRIFQVKKKCKGTEVYKYTEYMEGNRIIRPMQLILVIQDMKTGLQPTTERVTHSGSLLSATGNAFQGTQQMSETVNGSLSLYKHT